MTRPHFHATISELEVLYDENKHNAQVVEAILQELKHRSRKKAKRLAKRIQNDCPPVAGHVEQRKESEQPDSPPITYDRSIVSGLVECLKTNACAELSYKAKSGYRTQRVVSLQRFSNLNNKWYVDSWCHERRFNRSFRIDRIESVTTRSEEAKSISREQVDKELSWQAQHKLRFVYADEIDSIFDFIFNDSPMGAVSQTNNGDPAREQLDQDIETESKEASMPRVIPERQDTRLAWSIEESPKSLESDDSVDLDDLFSIEERSMFLPKQRPETTYEIWTDEEILDVLRDAATMAFPLTVIDYTNLLESSYVDGPSVPTITNRFRSWGIACDKAGVESGKTGRVLGSGSKFSEQDLLLSVRQYFEQSRKNTFADYEDWARKNDAPSGATLRNRLGTWRDIKMVGLRNVSEQGDED